MDAVIAVDTGSSDLEPENDIAIARLRLDLHARGDDDDARAPAGAVRHLDAPPMILIRPKVSHIGWFSFTHTDEVIEAGYTAAMEALHALTRNAS